MCIQDGLRDYDFYQNSLRDKTVPSIKAKLLEMVTIEQARQNMSLPSGGHGAEKLRQAIEKIIKQTVNHAPASVDVPAPGPCCMTCSGSLEFTIGQSNSGNVHSPPVASMGITETDMDVDTTATNTTATTDTDTDMDVATTDINNTFGSVASLVMRAATGVGTFLGISSPAREDTLQRKPPAVPVDARVSTTSKSYHIWTKAEEEAVIDLASTISINNHRKWKNVEKGLAKKGIFLTSEVIRQHFKRRTDEILWLQPIDAHDDGDGEEKPEVTDDRVVVQPEPAPAPELSTYVPDRLELVNEALQEPIKGNVLAPKEKTFVVMALATLWTGNGNIQWENVEKKILLWKRTIQTVYRNLGKDPFTQFEGLYARKKDAYIEAWKGIKRIQTYKSLNGVDLKNHLKAVAYCEYQTITGKDFPYTAELDKTVIDAFVPPRRKQYDGAL